MTNFEDSNMSSSAPSGPDGVESQLDKSAKFNVGRANRYAWINSLIVIAIILAIFSLGWLLFANWKQISSFFLKTGSVSKPPQTFSENMEQEPEPRKLFDVKSGEKVSTLRVSLEDFKKGDLKYFAILDDKTVIINNKKGDPCERILAYDMSLWTSFHIAYVCEKSQKRSVYLDNVLVSGTFQVSNEPRLTLSDSARLAFVATEGEKEFVVVDGKPEQKYDRISSLQISEDGSVVSYVAKLEGKEFVVRNGTLVGTEYESVSRLYSESDRYSYHAYKNCPLQSSFNYCVARLVVNGNEMPLDEQDVEEGGVLADGGYYALVKRGDKKAVIFNGSEIGMYDTVMGVLGFESPKFSHDQKRYAFTASSNGKMFAVIDGKKQTEHEFVSEIIVSPDFSTIEYWTKDGCGGADAGYYTTFLETGPNCRAQYVFNGKAYKVSPKAVHVKLSPDGKKMAVVVVDKCEEPSLLSKCTSKIEENGKQIGSEYNYINNISYIDNKLALLVSEEPFGVRGRFILGGVESEIYDRILDSFPASGHDPVLTPDGKHYVYAVRVGVENGQEFMIIDGKKYGPYEQILSSSYSDDGKKVYYIYRNGQSIFFQTFGLE